MTHDTSPDAQRPQEPTERIARLKAAWAAHAARRSVECTHPKPPVLYQQINLNGSRSVYKGCPDCGTRIGPANWISHDGLDLGEIPVGADHRTVNPPCQVCGAWGTELHHWAPRALFGIEADHWPTAWLCVPHHAEWHKRINDPSRPF